MGESNKGRVVIRTGGGVREGTLSAGEEKPERRIEEQPEQEQWGGRTENHTLPPATRGSMIGDFSVQAIISKKQWKEMKDSLACSKESDTRGFRNAARGEAGGVCSS